MFVKTEPILFEVVTGQEADEIISVLKDRYKLIVSGPVQRFLEKTAASRVYKANTERGDIVLKKSFWYEGEDSAVKKAFEKAYAVSEELRKRGVPLPETYKNSGGSFITSHGGNNIVILQYFGGEHFVGRDEEFFSAGKALGLFHKRGSEYLKENPLEKQNIERDIPVEKSYEESRALYDQGLKSKILGAHECTMPEVCELLRQNINVIDKTIDFIDSSFKNKKLSVGVLHNDFHTNNALYNKDGSLVIFLDIDQLGVGPFVWDIGNSLMSFTSNFLSKNNISELENKVAIFLKGYHEVFPLPLAEYELILASTQRWDVMRILRSIRRHHYENNRLSDLTQKIKDRLISRIIKAPEVFAFITPPWLKKTLDK